MQALRPIRAALLLVLMVAATAPGQSLRDQTSLRFVPATASIYSVNLRNAEQFQRFVNSRAFAKLKSLPIVQMGFAQWHTNDRLSEVREFLAQPENQQLVKVLLDGLSHETFVYGDARHGKWLGTLAQISNRMNLANMKAAQQGLESDEATALAVAKLLEDEPDLLRVPGTVIGFRLSDKAPAVAQLARLETLITQVIEAKRPDLKDRFSRQQIGDSSFLTLKLDGKMVDWNDVLSEADLDTDSRDKLTAQLTKITFSISLGIYEDYLLLALGEDDSSLRSIGQGDLLVDHDKLAPVAKYFDRKVTSIGYAGAEFMEQIASANQQLDQMAEMARTVLPMVPLGEDEKDELVKDIELFATQAKALQPKLGAVSGVSFEVDGGYESVSYNWSENRTLDASKPLTILDHVGGDPIGFYATRRKEVEADERFVLFWLGRLGHHIDQIAVPFLDEDQKQLYAEVTRRLKPLLARLGAANRDKLKPALADGQSAIVLDAQLSKTQWHFAMPPADEPVSLPEITCVWSVSDAKLLREGATEYFSVLQDMVTAASEMAPDKVPPIQLPKPLSDETDAGTIYSYALPPMLGLGDEIAPNAGLSDSTLAISLVPSATKRVLQSKAIDATGPLANIADRSLGSAWQFKTDRFVQLLRPWVQYGLQMAEQEGSLDPMIQPHVAAILDVLECVRTCSGISYIEDGVIVSHSRSEFKDLE